MVYNIALTCEVGEIYGCLGVAAESGLLWAINILLPFCSECDLALLAKRARQCGHGDAAQLLRLP
jgi:hypothetical protein